MFVNLGCVTLIWKCLLLHVCLLGFTVLHCLFFHVQAFTSKRSQFLESQITMWVSGVPRGIPSKLPKPLTVGAILSGESNAEETLPPCTHHPEMALMVYGKGSLHSAVWCPAWFSPVGMLLNRGRETWILLLVMLTMELLVPRVRTSPWMWVYCLINAECMKWPIHFSDHVFIKARRE